MDWIITVSDSWLQTSLWFAGLALAFGLLARLTPCNPGMYWWKDLRAVATDCMYWFVVPLFLRMGRLLMLVAALSLLCGGREPGLLPVKDWPLWAQCVAILLIQDFLQYWIHRAFHGRLAWPFHAVHHSPTTLDWTATQRFHPVNHLLEFALADVVVLLLGFSPVALVVLGPFNIVYSAMVHANLNWTFGPLRYVFASPVFHRWHHSTQENGTNRNFAPTFPFLDVLFGTFHMPPGKCPEHFGNGEADYPEDFLGQFVHPFRIRTPKPAPRDRRQAAAALAGSALVVAGVVVGGAYLKSHSPAYQSQAAVTDRADGPPVQEPPPWSNRSVLSVALSADGRHIVTGGEDGTLVVWDAETCREEKSWAAHARAVRGVAVSADGRHVASGAEDGTVKVWDAPTGKEERSLGEHAAAVCCLDFSADGREVVAGTAGGAAQVWDAGTGKEGTTTPGHRGAVLGVALSADGRRAASAGRGAIRVWDVLTGQEEFTLTGPPDAACCVALSPDGRHVVTGSSDQVVRVWHVASGRELRALTGHAGAVSCVAFSPDGRLLVSGGEDRVLRVWDVATGRSLGTLAGHAAPVTSLAVSAGGRRIVSRSRDGMMKVWDERTAGAAP